MIEDVMRTSLALGSWWGPQGCNEAAAGCSCKCSCQLHAGRTTLHESAGHSHADVVSRLLGAGADVHAARVGGATALFYAAGDGDDAVVKQLLDAGADVHAACSDSITRLPCLRQRVQQEWRATRRPRQPPLCS